LNPSLTTEFTEKSRRTQRKRKAYRRNAEKAEESAHPVARQGDGDG